MIAQKLLCIHTIWWKVDKRQGLQTSRNLLEVMFLQHVVRRTTSDGAVFLFIPDYTWNIFLAALIRENWYMVYSSFQRNDWATKQTSLHKIECGLLKAVQPRVPSESARLMFRLMLLHKVSTMTFARLAPLIYWYQGFTG